MIFPQAEMINEEEHILFLKPGMVYEFQINDLVIAYSVVHLDSSE